MLDPSAPPPHTAAIPLPTRANADDPDWAWPVMARQLRMLGELAEMGLNVARAVERQAVGAGEPEGASIAAPVIQDIALAYARVSRAVRLTLMLQSQAVKDLQVLEESYAETDGLRTDQRKADITRVVKRTAQAEHGEGEAVERLVREAAERLDEEDRHGDLFDRPLSETVARVCRDLGLSPDWPRLAQEAWARAEIAGGEAGAPLAAAMAQRAPQRRPAAGPTPFRRTPQAASPQAASP